CRPRFRGDDKQIALRITNSVSSYARRSISAKPSGAVSARRWRRGKWYFSTILKSVKLDEVDQGRMAAVQIKSPRSDPRGVPRRVRRKQSVKGDIVLQRASCRAHRRLGRGGNVPRLRPDLGDGISGGGGAGARQYRALWSDDIGKPQSL